MGKKSTNTLKLLNKLKYQIRAEICQNDKMGKNGDKCGKYFPPFSSYVISIQIHLIFSNTA